MRSTTYLLVTLLSSASFIVSAPISPRSTLLVKRHFWCNNQDSDTLCLPGERMTPIDSYACGVIKKAQRLNDISPPDTPQEQARYTVCPGQDSGTATTTTHHNPPSGSDSDHDTHNVTMPAVTSFRQKSSKVSLVNGGITPGMSVMLDCKAESGSSEGHYTLDCTLPSSDS